MPERLHKLMAAMGAASRRASEKLILEGRVSVNGQIVNSLGFKVDPDLDEIVVDGKKLKKPRLVYLLMNKPKGAVSTVRDPQRRRTVMEFLPETTENLKPVGRLDFNTEGLLIFTNDGEFIQRMTHPKHGIEKSYVATVLGKIEDKQLERLRKGVILDGRRTAPAKLVRSSENRHPKNDKIEITIHEGRNRQVRRMFEAVGAKVIELKRTKIGFLSLGNLKPGECRLLKAPEIQRLMRLSAVSSGSTEKQGRE
jgi:pseudouridine synthase